MSRAADWEASQQQGASAVINISLKQQHQAPGAQSQSSDTACSGRQVCSSGAISLLSRPFTHKRAHLAEYLASIHIHGGQISASVSVFNVATVKYQKRSFRSIWTLKLFILRPVFRSRRRLTGAFGQCLACMCVCVIRGDMQTAEPHL